MYNYSGFLTSKVIDYNYYLNEFRPFIVYGSLGIGKSSYAMQVAAYTFGTRDNPDWEKMKEYIVFKPEDFVTRCKEMLKNNDREKLLIWDDAGLWLYAMEYNDPFVMAVTKYLNVARTNWASIIFTTPTPTMVIKKLRTFPDCFTIKITKAKSDLHNPKRERIATCYRFHYLPDMKKSRVKKEYKDVEWYAILPNDVFKWYKPLRDRYTQEAVKEMERYIFERTKDEDKAEEKLEQVQELITL